MSDEIKADRLVKAYVNIRDKRRELSAKFEEEDAKLSSTMELVEAELMKLCKEIGADSVKTQYGTVYRTVKTRYETTDWDSMYKFIKEHDIPQVLTKGINTANMKQFLDENPTLMPIGMNVNNKYTVKVLRK